MKIYLYSFSKKRNSTAIPSGAGYEVDVQLKENCSVFHPSFILNHNAADFNYIRAVFPSSGGSSDTYYYFVDDITFNTDRIITANCSCDSLATMKSEILGTRANIMYCADSPRDNIVDPRLPVFSDVFLNETAIDLGDPLNVPTPYEGEPLLIHDMSNTGALDGSVIISVTGKGSFGAYMLQYSSDLPEILDGVDDYTNGIVDILAGLKQLFYGGTAAECLKAAFVLPINLTPADIGASSNEPLYLGNYPCKINSPSTGQLIPIYVYQIKRKIVRGKYRLSIPWLKPETWQRSAPYTNLYLYFPMVGIINLNTSDMISDIFVDVSYSINVTSGDISILVEGVKNTTLETHIIGAGNGNMALNTPFGSTGIDTSRLTQSIGVGAAAAGASLAMAATGNFVGAGLTLAGGLASAASGTLAAMGGNGYGDGGLGGGSSNGLDKNIRLIYSGRTLTAQPAAWSTTYGKPFMAPDTISNHSGLVITEAFSLSAAYPKEMIEEVNRLMDGGVYIE